MSKPITHSLRQYLRGIAGSLLFSLPLLYTMELWWAGFIAGPLQLLIYMSASFLLLLGYNRYAGIRKAHTFLDVVSESVEEMGLGLIVAAFLLWLTGRITVGMGINEIVGKIVIESMTVAIGISVGKAQLGGAGSGKEEEGQEQVREPIFVEQFIMAVCGAVLVAANIAPTEEVVVIAAEASVLKLVIIAVMSIVLGTSILYYTNFLGAERWVRPPGGWRDVLTGSVMMYLVSLMVAAFMLWFFGRFGDASMLSAVSDTVVLAFPSALGASAGRLLIQV